MFVAERSTKILKNKIYNDFNTKNVYINKLENIADEYNNKYHRTIKMKPVDVRSSTCLDFGIEYNDKDSKFEVGHHVKILKNEKKRLHCLNYCSIDIYGRRP